MQQNTLSIGRITTLWLVCKYSDGETSMQVLRQRTERELTAASTLFDDAVNLAYDLGLLKQHQNKFLRTPKADRIFDWKNEFPTHFAYRNLLLLYIKRYRPLWALNAVLPRAVFLADLGPLLIECLGAAKVLESPKDSEWWRAIYYIVEGWERINLEEIGRYAEELTLQYERQRLSANGLHQLASQVRWVSQESDAYGYDVLSFCGDRASLFNAQESDPLRIEVKGMARSLSSANFYLTRNEWRVAKSKPHVPYCFYIWRQPRTGSIPLVKTPDSIHQFLPKNCSETGCYWTHCRLMIPVPKGY